jgi:hypothetical protein
MVEEIQKCRAHELPTPGNFASSPLHGDFKILVTKKI